MSLTPQEEQILDSIIVNSENNPEKPEFPSDNPKFPATPTYQIQVPGFNTVWIKDESYNPTGTHKDRLAWEIVVTYRLFLLAKQRGQFEEGLPQMSIISSGSAALAIQTALSKYHLPNLKVLVDSTISEETCHSLKSIGCEIYKTDLRRKALNSSEILTITNNLNGFDITSAEALDPSTRFYDWLSYEIINESPEYCFIPFGTGNLYENILNVSKRELTGETCDPRFKGNIEILRTCNFLGATTNDPHSKADKLFSPHLPFVHHNEQWMRLYRMAGYCGPKSGVYTVQDNYLHEAFELASSQHIMCEYSGIAGLALLLQMKEQLPRDKKMLVVSTGKAKIA